MKTKLLFLIGVAFGERFLEFENLENSPKYNETCDALENAKMCENKCVADLQDCINSCQDENCIGSCQRNIFSCLDGNAVFCSSTYFLYTIDAVF